MLDIRNIKTKLEPFKPLHYWPIYEDLFEKINLFHDKTRPFKILEIGIAKGGSIEMWYKICEHLGIDVEISAIDIRCGGKTKKDIFSATTDDGSVRLKVCNSNDIDSQNEFYEDRIFDLIIDDGSHKSEDMMFSFNELFNDRLQDGGVYIIEDLHTHYWEDEASAANSISNQLRALIDAQNFAYYLHSLNEDRKTLAEQYHDKVSKLEFYDSVAMVWKGKTYKDRSQYDPLGSNLKKQDRVLYSGIPIGTPDGSKLMYGRKKDKVICPTDKELANEYKRIFPTWDDTE